MTNFGSNYSNNIFSALEEFEEPLLRLEVPILPNQGQSFLVSKFMQKTTENIVKLRAYLKPKKYEIYHPIIRWEIKQVPSEYFRLVYAFVPAVGNKTNLYISQPDLSEQFQSNNVLQLTDSYNNVQLQSNKVVQLTDFYNEDIAFSKNEIPGKEFKAVQCKIRAKVDINGRLYTSQWLFIKQDEIDMLRQEYMAYGTREVPERSEFSKRSSEEFQWQCKCNKHNGYGIWHIESEVKKIKEKMPHDVQNKFTINSGYRCPQWNRHDSVKGGPDSEHIYGNAVDIKVPPAGWGWAWSPLKDYDECPHNVSQKEWNYWVQLRNLVIQLGVINIERDQKEVKNIYGWLHADWGKPRETEMYEKRVSIDNKILIHEKNLLPEN